MISVNRERLDLLCTKELTQHEHDSADERCILPQLGQPNIHPLGRRQRPLSHHLAYGPQQEIPRQRELAANNHGLRIK